MVQVAFIAEIRPRENQWRGSDFSYPRQAFLQLCAAQKWKSRIIEITGLHVSERKFKHFGN